MRFKKENDAIRIVKKIVSYFNIQVSHKTIREFLMTHPQYPTLVAISDAFDEWNIKNAAIKLDEHQIEQVQTPFLSCIGKNNETYVWVTKIENGGVVFFDSKKGETACSIDDFIQEWSGLVMFIESNSTSGEKHYNDNRKQELINKFRIPFLVSLFIIAFSIGIISEADAQINISWFLLVFSGLIGAIASLVLMSYENNAAPAYLKAFCKIGKKIDCLSIINSKISKLFGVFSWAEIGTIYFIGNLFFILLNGNNPDILKIQALINFIALPYTLFSIGYQAIVIKKWCLFCLSVQTLLWFQFIILIPFFTLNFTGITLKEINSLLISYLIPLTGMILVASFKSNNKHALFIKRELNTFKWNHSFLKNIVLKEVQYKLEEANPLLLNNGCGSPIITIVTNPFCVPCADAYKTIEPLIKRYPALKFQLIFYCGENLKDDRYQVAKYFISLSEEKGSKEIVETLSLWYKNNLATSETWRTEYAKPDNNITTESTLEKHISFCKKAGIVHTPTIFINNAMLPDLYSYNDLPLFIPRIIQICNN